MTPHIKQNIFRLNVAFVPDVDANNKDIVLRTFPASNISNSYNFRTALEDDPNQTGKHRITYQYILSIIQTKNFFKELWYYYTNKFKNLSILNSGPYIDRKGTHRSLISMSSYQKTKLGAVSKFIFFFFFLNNKK